MAGKPWRRVVDELRARIVSGDLPPGSRLPSITEIMADTGISSAQTAQQIFHALVAEGLIRTRRGDGAFVRTYNPLIWRPAEMEHPSHRRDTTDAADAWAAHVASQGRSPEPEPKVDVETGPASVEVAEGLDIPVGGLTVSRIRLRYVDGVLTQRSAFIVPWWLTEVPGGNILKQAGNVVVPGGILAHLGFPMAAWRERIRSRMPSQEERDALSLPPGTTVLVHTIVGRCTDGRPIRFTRTVSRGDEIEIEYEGRL